MNFFKISLKFLALVFVLSIAGCDEGAQDVVLDGITINGEVSKIKLGELVAEEVTATSVTLKGSILSTDGDYSILDYGFVYSYASQNPSNSDMMISFGATEEPVEFDTLVQGLDPASIYYVKPFVETEDGFGYGALMVFNTAEVPADVVVINEGNFSSGDGSMSTYNSITEEVDLSVFAGANGFPIAATIQNVMVHDDKVYAVTNVADKLEVFDLNTFESAGYLNQGLNNPYSFAAIGNTGVITNWGEWNANWELEGSSIVVVDLTTLEIDTTISLDVQPQHVIAHQNEFFVSMVGGSTINVFDPETYEITSSIETSFGPDKMVIDKNGAIWVMCTSGSLVQIDTNAKSVIQTIEGIMGSGYNEKMVIDSEGDDLYYLSSSGYPDYNTSVYTLSIEASSAPISAVVSGNNFYGVGVSPQGILYVANSNAFQGNGYVDRYNLQGEELGTFAAGRGPNGFIFR